MKTYIYGSPFCPGCERIKEEFSNNNITFEYLDVNNNDEYRNELISNNYLSIPVVKIVDDNNKQLFFNIVDDVTKKNIYNVLGVCQ